MKFTGKTLKYGDNVDTDVIIPARYLNTIDKKELASHCMEDIDKDFIHKVENGDVIDAKTPVAKTEVLAINDGVASIKGDVTESRRLLINCSNFETVVDTKNKPTVKKGDFIKLDSEVASSGETQVNGVVVTIDVLSGCAEDITRINERINISEENTIMKG